MDLLGVCAAGIAALLAGLAAGLLAGRASASRRTDEAVDSTLAESLEQAHDQLLLVQGVLDAIDAAVCCYDTRGELILYNQKALDMAEHGRFSLRRGETTDPLVHGPDGTTPLPPGERIIDRALRGESAEQTVWLGPPGDQIAVVASARQVRDGRGEHTGAVVAAWDVTDILEAMRVREEFLTTVSHELRTPLTSIIGYQELLGDELAPADETARRLLETAQRNARVMLTRVSQLLQASAVDQLVLQHREVDTCRLLREALHKHRPAAAKHDIELALDTPPELHAVIDPDRWEQVVDNLVSNAVKYTPRGGRVHVSLADQDGELTLHVADTGIGMNAHERSRIFERFYRSSTARHRAIPGIGVGMSITRDIVTAHGGRIRLDSSPGEGTRVWVHVPRRPAPAGRHARTA